MKSLLLSILLVAGMAGWAGAEVDKYKDKQPVEWSKPDKGKDYKTYQKEAFTTELENGHYKNLHKYDIAEDKLLTVEESEKVKLSLWNEGLIDEQNKKVREGRKLIFKQARPAKNDYKHDFDRGTIYYEPTLRNYSFHKVIIPDGTTVRDSNFTQRKPDTLAIQGENLTFIDCNLVNVRKGATWILQGSSNTQVKNEILEQIDLGDGNTKLVISHKVKEDKPNGQFMEIMEDEEIIPNNELANSLLYFSE